MTKKLFSIQAIAGKLQVPPQYIEQLGAYGAKLKLELLHDPQQGLQFGAWEFDQRCLQYRQVFQNVPTRRGCSNNTRAQISKPQGRQHKDAGPLRKPMKSRDSTAGSWISMLFG